MIVLTLTLQVVFHFVPFPGEMVNSNQNGSRFREIQPRRNIFTLSGATFFLHNPMPSIYGIFTYIWLIFMVDV